MGERACERASVRVCGCVRALTGAAPRLGCEGGGAHDGRLVRVLVAREGADARQEAAEGILGVDAALHGPPLALHLLLREAQLLSGGDADHLLDEIDAGDALGDGVLDLQPRVHLEEVVLLARVDEELDGARRAVADRLGERHRLLAHRLDGARREAGRRRLLDDLLVAPLDRAVALGQVHRVAVRVGDQLDLDVARVLDVPLDEDAVVAKRRGGLARREREALPRLLLVPRDPHPLAAAARRRLDHHREPHLGRHLGRLVLAAQHAEEAGDRVDARLRSELLALDLVAHRADRKRAGADERLALGLDRLREGGVLREEAVARVDGLRAGGAHRLDDRVDLEVRLGRRRLADAHRLVRQPHVRRARVRLRVDGDRLDAEALGGAHDAARDLAAVGHHQRVEEAAHRVRVRATLANDAGSGWLATRRWGGDWDASVDPSA